MAGQGTVAVELLEQAPETSAVFVTAGGGGLIGGMATWIKHVRPGCRVIGCQPAASAVMHASVRAGHVVDLVSEDTLADGSAGATQHVRACAPAGSGLTATRDGVGAAAGRPAPPPPPAPENLRGHDPQEVSKPTRSPLSRASGGSTNGLKCQKARSRRRCASCWKSTTR